MLYVFATTERLEAIRRLLEKEERLPELVECCDYLERPPRSSYDSLIVNARGIELPIDWREAGPPYLLAQQLPFDPEHFLGLVFAKLGNIEKAWAYLGEEDLLRLELLITYRLQRGETIKVEELRPLFKLLESGGDFDAYRLRHNLAVLQHYGALDDGGAPAETRQFYEQALEHAPNAEYRAFSAKHFAARLLDRNNPSGADLRLQEALQDEISEEARYALRALLTKVWMRQLDDGQDDKLLTRLKNTLWETLQYFEKQDRRAETALLLQDAAQIAHRSDSLTEALGYLTKAIRLFEAEQLTALAGQAWLDKGALLYRWAQKGNPQFYKPAIESYLEALKVYPRDTRPDNYADIQHHLAVLYAEMPAEPKHRSIWAGRSAASFDEALSFFTKADYPYEYGMITNNYGNALTKFPAALHSDNFEKALWYYREALSVRTTDYPRERAATLLNYLEASWRAGNQETPFNEARYTEMWDKAQEVLQLTEETTMVEEARKHLQMLRELYQSAKND